MDRGTYAAASGGLLQMRKLEVVTNNLSNLNTVGFKKQYLVSKEQSFDETLASQVTKYDPYAKGDQKRASGVSQIETVVDFSQGPISNTGNPLNVALTREGDFFAVNTPEGTQYTRAGNFTLNAQGQLVTPDGLQVLGDGGPINAVGGKVSIVQNGEVQVDGKAAGKLRVVHFNNTKGLSPVGGVRFKAGSNAEAPTNVDPQLATESLEMANVTAINSMLDLITTTRAFQAYTKTSQSVDQMNRDAINEVGRGR